MSKILETEKILAVKAYLQGKGTTHSQAARVGVAEPTFREWVTKYKTFGESGLRASTKRMQYTAEIKKAAVMAYWEKYMLTLREAAEYFHIGEKKMRQIVDDNLDANFLLESGHRIMIKRRLFEEYLDNATVI